MEVCPFSALMDVSDGVIHIDMEGVHSNIVMIEVIKPGLTASEFCTRASQVSTHTFRYGRGTQ